MPPLREALSEALRDDQARCTPGCEFQCATAKSPYCHCACGGKNHGKHRELLAQRNASGTPWQRRDVIAALERARAARPQWLLQGRTK